MGHGQSANDDQVSNGINAEVIRIAPANHFTALPLCKPAGVMILASEKDDSVCTDPEGTDRAAVHQKIIDSIARDLGL